METGTILDTLKSKIVISEIYSNVYATYLKITKHNIFSSASSLYLFAGLSIYTIRTRYAGQRDVVNTLFVIEI